MVGLTAVAGRPVGTYSKGMARRIGLAQALINDPDLLILDEPTTGLDPIGTRQIKDLIAKLAERGKTVLLCSHLLADVEDVCHRIAILYGGKVQAQGRVKDLLQQTNKTQITTDAISDTAVNRIRQILNAEHAACEVTAPMEKLETFFIKTVVEAQQQARPTSGAVSTTQIGDFLTAGGRKENILDKLVSTSASEARPAERAKTDAVQPRETVVPEPNKDLLSKLTQTGASPQTERVAPTPAGRNADRGAAAGDQKERAGRADPGRRFRPCVRSGPWRRHTIRQALRMKVAAVFIVLLFVLLPVLGLTATGDGTLKGRLQTCVSYGLSLTSLLLSLLTIIVSIYAITSDIEQRQIYTVVTKPIRRYQILLGKVLGVIVLDIVLLTLFAGLVYGVTVLMPRFVGASDEECWEARNEFYTARASLVPPVIDVQKEVAALYNRLLKNEQLDVLYPRMTQAEVLKQLTNRLRLEKRAASVGRMLVWEFRNVKPRDPNQSLFIRFKYDVSVTPPDEQVYGEWHVGDQRQFQQGARPDVQTPIFQQTRKDSVRKFHELEVPASVVARDGYLAVGFRNPPLNQTVVLFPVEDGLEVLYKADTFTANFVRSVLLILCRLMFLACLGVLAASFLSFPVAILFCVVIFFTGTISGFIIESFGYMSQNISQVYAYTVQGLIQLLPQFDKSNPTQFLVPARLMTWGFLGHVVLVMVFVKAALLLLLALLIFSYRELAKVVV